LGSMRCNGKIGKCNGRIGRCNGRIGRCNGRKTRPIRGVTVMCLLMIHQV
jgi:hypothetical protein